MQTTLQGIDLSVAILMDDLASVKEIASALRQENILAQHFQNLDEFWVACNMTTPDLVIVDVTKMGHENVQFRQHPKVLDQTLCYAFYSKDSTKILLQSTLGLKPFAYLHKDPSLSSQVTNLVRQKVEMIHIQKEKKILEDRCQKLQLSAQRLITEKNEAREFRAGFELIKNICQEIESASSTQDFLKTLISKLHQWEIIQSYGVLELNQSGQKLFSPESNQDKYHPFPSLWLGQANHHGIEPFAIEMAQQVANDLFETPPLLLKIYAGNQHPDILLFITYEDEKLKEFPWAELESMLTSALRRHKLYQQLPQYTSQFTPMWEALDNIDKMQKAGPDQEVRILCLSLIPLVNVAKKRVSNKFYWSSFFNEFFIQLAGRIHKSTKLSLFGPWHVIFFIQQENVESEFKTLQSYIQQFSFWKFFEDTTQILSEEMLPTLKLIPASAAQYLKIFQKEIEELAAKEDSKRSLNLNRPEGKRISSK